MFVLLSACLFASAASASAADSSSVITSATDLATAVCDFYQPGRRFDLTATCQQIDGAHISFVDAQAAMKAECRPEDFANIRPGDRLRLSGQLVCGRTAPDRIHPLCERVEVLGHGAAPDRISAQGPQFIDGTLDFRLISATGEIVDVFQDEIDANSIYLLLDCQGTRIHAPITKNSTFAPKVYEMIGATVRVDGRCDPAPYMSRRKIGRIISVDTITLLSSPSQDPFAVPELGLCLRLQPETIARLGRRRQTGTVLARWDRMRFLIKTDELQLINVELLKDPLPDCGKRIDVVGLPETDLYAFSLVRAHWRISTSPAPSAPAPETAPAELQLTSFRKGTNGVWRYDIHQHGRRARLRGIVRCLPDELGNDNHLYVESRGQVFPLDISTLVSQPRLEIGSEIEAVGTCIMEAEKWRPNATLQNIRGFVLAINGEDDILVLSRPSWWTPARLFIIIGALLLVLFAVLVWNASLRILAERRGRALFRAQIDKVSSELRIAERTRLAVELHDALSQNLTGVSMEIEAAARNETKGLPAVLSHVAVADKALKSCRQELKNSLWDLRSEALEMPDLADAVRRTLLPHAKNVETAIRMSIPRARLSDNTTHEILCIIRELAQNAIRHGQATVLRIAGSIKDSTLLLSVRDNGTGFDPAVCPGSDEGHFGLEGIRERLRAYDGDLAFERLSDCGMRAVVSIRIPNLSKGESS